MIANLEKVKDPLEIQPKDYYHYKLVGVVIHVGTADWGHYYSYIDTHRDKHTFYNPDLEE